MLYSKVDVQAFTTASVAMALCSLVQGSYYFAEFMFPDFSRQNEKFSLTNFFIRDTSKTILSTQM